MSKPLAKDADLIRQLGEAMTAADARMGSVLVEYGFLRELRDALAAKARSMGQGYSARPLEPERAERIARVLHEHNESAYEEESRTPWERAEQMDRDDMLEVAEKVIACISSRVEGREPDDLRTEIGRLRRENHTLRNIIDREADPTERRAQGEAELREHVVRIIERHMGAWHNWPCDEETWEVSEDRAADEIIGDLRALDRRAERAEPVGVREAPDWFATPEAFAEHLHRIGWASPCDAQWDKIREVWRALASPPPQQDV